MTKLASELDDFPDLIRAVARERNLPSAAVEKDYYVVRALRVLRERLPGQFVFKGGTSLAKGWNVIDRFSEDIDLLFRSEEGGVALSKGELDRRMKRAQPVLEAEAGLSGTFVRSEKGVHRSVSFTYPRVFETTGGYSDKVLLEMGVRGGVQPSTVRPIRSYLTEFVEARGPSDLAEDLTPFEVECLDVRRTFVEKLFAVHAAYVRDMALGRTRHYYDLHRMAKLNEVRDFLGTDEYVAVYRDVEAFSRVNWPDAALPVEGAFAESPAFNPDRAGRAKLRSHYEDERDLFFTEPPTMDEILNDLRELLPRLKVS